MTQDEQLLAAAFLDGDGALEAWSAWRDAVDIDTLDPPRYMLLPQLFRNLTALGVDDPIMDRLRSPYRHCWVANQLRLESTASAIRLIQAKSEGVELTGVAALALTVYPDAGARRIALPELRIAAGNRRRALRALRFAGWRAQGPPARRALRPFVRGRQLLVDAGGTPLALTWRAPVDGVGEGPRACLGVHGVSVEVTGRAALLVRACRSAAAGGPTRLASLGDALATMRAAGEADWHKVERFAAGPDGADVARTVAYLQRTFDHTRRTRVMS